MPGEEVTYFLIKIILQIVINIFNSFSHTRFLLKYQGFGEIRTKKVETAIEFLLRNKNKKSLHNDILESAQKTIVPK